MYIIISELTLSPFYHPVYITYFWLLQIFVLNHIMPFSLRDLAQIIKKKKALVPIVYFNEVNLTQ